VAHGGWGVGNNDCFAAFIVRTSSAGKKEEDAANDYLAEFVTVKDNDLSVTD